MVYISHGTSRRQHRFRERKLRINSKDHRFTIDVDHPRDPSHSALVMGLNCNGDVSETEMFLT